MVILLVDSMEHLVAVVVFATQRLQTGIVVVHWKVAIPIVGVNCFFRTRNLKWLF
jgi:hypothetical protein